MKLSLAEIHALNSGKASKELVKKAKKKIDAEKTVKAEKPVEKTAKPVKK